MKSLLINPQQAHIYINQTAWPWIKSMLIAGHRLEIEVDEEGRTIEQNKAQWPILQAFSEQKQWPVDGKLCWMTPDDWKDVLTAAFKNEVVRLAAGLDGGVVMLGQRTSKFKRGEFNQWLEFLNASAAIYGIRVPAPKYLEAA